MDYVSDFQRFIKVNKLKQNQVANYLDTTPQYINQVVNGKCSLSDEKLEKLAQSGWDVSMLEIPEHIRIKPAVMTAIDDDGNLKVEINTGNDMLSRKMPRAKALHYIRTGKLDLNKYRVSKIGDGKIVEVTPIQSDVTEAEIVPAEVIEEIREEVKEEIREQVIEEIREEVKEEIKQEGAIAVIPVDIANQVDVDIKKYIEENESELEKLTPSDLTGDVDGVEKIRKDSMSPTFVAGDRVFIKFLKHKSHIVDGGIYYFNLRNRPTMIRQVKIEGDNLRLIAFNSQYSDIVTDFNNVLRVAEVNGMYRSFFSNQYSEAEAVRRKKDEQIDKLIDQNQEALKIIGDLIQKK
jgi:phage repressor protein C with HTH and peptisase S24 domain